MMSITLRGKLQIRIACCVWPQSVIVEKRKFEIHPLNSTTLNYDYKPLINDFICNLNQEKFKILKMNSKKARGLPICLVIVGESLPLYSEAILNEDYSY